MNQPFRYWAFVSYSSKDARTARWLHRRLETYRVPRDLVGRPGRDGAVPRRVFPIFRDRDELPLSADLGASIEDALCASRYLIVLCTPDAAASRWVNEEIRYFKALGREDRILAVMLRGEPDQCFPPALRFRVAGDGTVTDERVEPVAGDLRRGGDGRRRVLLKALAGITGLGFDAFARRESRRVRRRRAAAFVAASILAAMGIYAWDYDRIKVRYFADIEYRFGVPRGIRPLDETARRGRPSYYRLESRRGLIRRVVRRQEVDATDEAIQQDIWYREDGSLRQIDLFNNSGYLVARHLFGQLRPGAGDTTAHFVQFRQELRDAPLAQVAMVASIATANTSDLARSDITAEERHYDKAGRLVLTRFLSAFHKPRANAEGVFGQRRMYQADGPWVATVENVGEDGRGVANRAGVRLIRVETRNEGDIVESRAVGEDHRPALFPQGHHRVLRAFDPDAKTLSESHYGPDDRPSVIRGGYHRVTTVFTDDNRISRIEFHGSGGELVLNDDGYAREERSYRNGQLESVRFFAPDGTPALNRNGLHGFVLRYSDSTLRASIAVDGTPVAVDGCAVVGIDWDARGDRAAESCFDARGAPALDTHGVFRTVFKRNERGQVVESAHFGTALEPVLYDGGFHRDISEFDDRGSLLSWSFWGVNGEPRLVDGYHRMTMTWDDRGNVMEAAFFGTDGRTPAARNGTHRVVNQRDEYGNLVVQSFFDSANRRVLVKRATFDSAGRQVRAQFFDGAGKAGADERGCHVWTVAYDPRGEITEERCFDVASRRIALAASVK